MFAFAQATPPVSGNSSSSSRPGKSEGATNRDAATNAKAIQLRAEKAQQRLVARPLSESDKRWMRQATGVSKALVEAGKIGQRRAIDPAVQGLAQALVVRHQALASELESFAQTENVSLKETPPFSTPLTRLAQTGGFDTVFVREVGIGMQTQAIERSGIKVAQSKEERLATLQTKYIDTLREGLSMAQQIPLRNASDKTEKSSSGDPASSVAKP